MKIVKTIILLLIIIGCASFIVFRYYGNQVESNWFNDNLREKMIYYPLFRGMYSLHWDGDAKYDYLLDHKFQKLIVEIDATKDCQLALGDLADLQAKIEILVKKPQGVEVIMGELIDDDDVVLLESNELYMAMENLSPRLRDYKTDGQVAALHVLCVDKNRNRLDSIGLTYRESTILLFYDRIEEVTASNPDTLPVYLTTTILHEFGHQLGLDHLDDESCIMAAKVESPGNAAGAIENIPQQFCQASLDTLESYKANFNDN